VRRDRDRCLLRPGRHGRGDARDRPWQKCAPAWAEVAIPDGSAAGPVMKSRRYLHRIVASTDQVFRSISGWARSPTTWRRSSP
jgi:hypothetical protein